MRLLILSVSLLTLTTNWIRCEDASVEIAKKVEDIEVPVPAPPSPPSTTSTTTTTTTTTTSSTTTPASPVVRKAEAIRTADARDREELLTEQDDMNPMGSKQGISMVPAAGRLYDYSNYAIRDLLLQNDSRNKTDEQTDFPNETTEIPNETTEFVSTSTLYGYDIGDEGAGRDYDSLKSRYGPAEPPSFSQENKYVLPENRLKELRDEFMYWYFDKGGPNDEGDWQRDIHSSTPQIHKNFNFQLPFYGFRFNYTRLSLHGYLEFSDPPENYRYPLTFPNKDWPKKRDPSFIGIFFSRCRIGSIRPEDVDQRSPGVYFRLERDIHTRTDVFGTEVRERLMWDIREGVIGADSFIPKHAAFITWKNISFLGGIDNALYKTNTFQLVLATDEVYAYAMFNYKELQWTTHTEAGGDTSNGEGGVPAYVGFNAGNGTQAFEYKPYSQASVIRDLTGRGWANGFPGRHIFRIDEKIMLGTCNKDIAGANLPLVFAPESGNMLGGTVVNITGPCFEENVRIKCRFDTEDVIGTRVDKNRAICVQPFLMAEGYVRFEVSIGDNAYNWKGKYFVETPASATERIHFQTNDVHEKSPAEIKITWDKYNLTSNTAASLTISLWGYKETTIRPQLMYIDVLESGVTNTGSYPIAPASYRLRDNKPELLDLQYGFIQINLTNPESYSGSTISPVLWSRPIPLGWYFGPQWERKYGSKWPAALCDKWLMYDRYLKNFASEVPVCPCTLDHALLDKGRFLPDFTCDKDLNPECYYHRGAVHCVRSGAPSLEGSEQQCCYDKNGYLMLSYDQQWGSRPRRSHNLGFIPWNEANKVPTLSQWFHDMIPFYTCCLWQEEQAVGCETLRFERRPTQDCVAYQSPSVAAVFGDPHIITFDNLEYTFNGKGEFVLVQGNQGKNKLNIQARFEQVSDNIYGEVKATLLTAVAAQDNSSAVIEVRLRPKEAQWRYRLDVLADGRKVYFDRPSLKIQHFAGVTVYTPTYILNQSEVIIMFPSGAGVEVIENKGFMSTRVYLPWNFVNKTRGLFGNWSFDVTDDFVLPDGTLAGVSTNMNSFEGIHKDFALYWMLEEREESEKGGALFTRENGRLGSFYSNRTFVPEYRMSPNDIIPANRSFDLDRANDLCGASYQCKYDYAMTLDRDMAHFTLNYHDSYVNIQKMNERRIKSCGVLETPRFGRKSNFLFIPGTKVTFECNQDFTLVGDQRRTCMADGHWDVPEYGYTECLRHVEYEQQQGWVTTGIIAGVMLPLIVCLLLIYMCYFRGRIDKNSNSSWRYWPQRTTYRKSSLSTLIDNPPKTEVDSDSSPPRSSPNRRLYDKIYRTREPIPGKPLVDFEDRDKDLKDVSDEDVKRFRDSCYYGSSDTSKSGSFASAAPELASISESSPDISKKSRKVEVVKEESHSESDKSSNGSPQNENIESNVLSSDSSESLNGHKYAKLENKSSHSSKASTSSHDPSSPHSSSKSSKVSASSKSSKPSTAAQKISTSSSERPKLSTSSAGSAKGMQEYSARNAGITWGIVLCVLVPIVLAIVFIIYKYKYQRETTGTAYIAKNPSTVEQQRFQAISQKDEGDDDITQAATLQQQ